MTERLPPRSQTVQAHALVQDAIRQLEEAVLQALFQLALENESYVRTAVIAERLGLIEQLPGPRGSTYAPTVVLAICRRLQQRGRVRFGRPDAAAHHGDKTTGWMIGQAEFQRRRNGETSPRQSSE